MDDRVLTEVPSSLKQLARLVVRGFYNIEDALIVDMLVRNPCMKEDDLCDLLKFERKMLRARIATLKSDKFIQVRLKMETGVDGKAQKVNYYFINYKTFVNVVKYKLDLMRKRMETEERDATSRASFKCPSCCKTFTDLEADQLFDFATEEFRCTFCKEVVEEDQSALPKKDSRLLLAKFNEQLEPLFILLREVEGIRLAPEVLEPEPTDLSSIRSLDKTRPQALRPPGDPSAPWSGDATRGGGFQVEETRVDVTIGDEAGGDLAGAARKERPIWMVESTIISDNNELNGPVGGGLLSQTADLQGSTDLKMGNKNAEDIMSVLLAHEKRAGTTGSAVATAAATASLSTRGAVAGLGIQGESGSESSDDDVGGNHRGATNSIPEIENVMEAMDSDDGAEDGDDDDDDLVPMVGIGNRSVPITEIDDTLIAQMTPAEKEAYIQVYQEHYSHMYD